MAEKIGVISDTHGLLRPEVLEALKGCDRILHGGDINRQSILDELEKMAPVHAVRGNNDKEWAEHLPKDLRIAVEGLTFYMVHNRKDAGDLTGVDVVVFGHSHRYLEQEVDGRLWLNPGSCGKRRFDQEITMAVVTADAGRVSVRKILIPQEEKKTMQEEKVFSMSTRKVYGCLVAKAERKGRTAEEVDRVTGWLTGYTPEEIRRQLERDVTYRTFFDEAPALNPERDRIGGTICKVKIAEIQDPTMKLIRQLDKLVDDLAKGKTIEKILGE